MEEIPMLVAPKVFPMTVSPTLVGTVPVPFRTAFGGYKYDLWDIWSSVNGCYTRHWWSSGAVLWIEEEQRTGVLCCDEGWPNAWLVVRSEENPTKFEIKEYKKTRLVYIREDKHLRLAKDYPDLRSNYPL